MKKKSENLILIIGNGFDLAHNLKTGFNHFADYFLNEIILIEITENLDNSEYLKTSFKEKVLRAKRKNKHQILKNLDDINSSKVNMFVDTSELLDYDNLVEVIINKGSEEIKNYIETKPNILKKILTNLFLGKLYANSYSNWFNIEQAYYQELTKILNSANQIKDITLGVETQDNPNTDLINLNKYFEEIKLEFKKYLNENINTSINKDVHYSIGKHYNNRKNITIINFNYTDTILHYLNFTLEIKNIHIHNELNQDIIFGYGDDTDVNYKKMKETKEKEYLRNFKTFHYLNSTNNRKVLNELSIKENYDVLVVGHSLDTSDKTILKKILDSNKCDYIELLKRSDLKTEGEKKEAHFELHANLSRIFTSETDLRDKLIPFDWSVNFPVMSVVDDNTIINREKELYLDKDDVFFF